MTADSPGKTEEVVPLTDADRQALAAWHRLVTALDDHWAPLELTAATALFEQAVRDCPHIWDLIKQEQETTQ